MRKLIAAAAALAGMALAAPAPAAAHVSIAIGLPGFAVVAAGPVPPPVFYRPTYYSPGYVRRHPSSSDGGTTAGVMGGTTAGSTSATSTD